MRRVLNRTLLFYYLYVNKKTYEKDTNNTI